MGTKYRNDTSTGSWHPARFLAYNNIKMTRNSRSRKANDVISHTSFSDTASISMLVHDEQHISVEKEVCVSSKLLRNTWLQALLETKTHQSLCLSNLTTICQMHRLHIKQKCISKYRNCKTVEWKGRNLFSDNLLSTSIIQLKKPAKKLRNWVSYREF